MQSYDGSDVIAFVSDAGNLVPIQVNRTLLIGLHEPALYYTEPNCASAPFIIRADASTRMMASHRVGTSILYANPNGTPQTVNHQSRHDAGDCSNQISTVTGHVPALQFTLPFTPPFHLEPEACFTPPPMVTALTPYGLGALALVLAFGAYLMKKERLAPAEI